ncbi:MAG TPA: NAD(P)H-binding protein [Polyangia bacterium]
MAGRRVLVTGATGFVGGALVPGLCAAGYDVVAASRRQVKPAGGGLGVEWRQCDLLRPDTLSAAFAGVKVAYYLVHSMGGGHADYCDLERRSARAFAEAAAKAGLERIVYLGGPAPLGHVSEHLRSRLEVGEILRAGPVQAVELRASMVIGTGSASWQIVRDLALRLPFMVLPRWLKSRTRPIGLDDVVFALGAAAALPLRESTWFDIPGPEILSGRQILERIAALRGRRILAVEVPFLTPQLSALWLRLVTRTDFSLARELVLGLGEDLLPKDGRFWQLIDHQTLLSFDEAAARALS